MILEQRLRQLRHALISIIDDAGRTCLIRGQLRIADYDFIREVAFFGLSEEPDYADLLNRLQAAMLESEIDRVTRLRAFQQQDEVLIGKLYSFAHRDADVIKASISAVERKLGVVLEIVHSGIVNGWHTADCAVVSLEKAP